MHIFYRTHKFTQQLHSNTEVAKQGLTLQNKQSENQATTCYANRYATCYATCYDTCFAKQGSALQSNYSKKQAFGSTGATALTSNKQVKPKQVVYLQSKARPNESIHFSYNVPEVKLFVNLLMKHGKKTKALYILEVAALLFIKSISKTDLDSRSSILTSSKTSPTLPDFALQASRAKQSKPCRDKATGFAPFACYSLGKKKARVEAERADTKKHDKGQLSTYENNNQRPCKAKTVSFFSINSSLLHSFFIKRKTFWDSSFTPEKFRGFVVASYCAFCFTLQARSKQAQQEKVSSKQAKQKRAQAFLCSPNTIGLLSKPYNLPKKVKSITNREKKRFWYLHNTPERWHQLSDVQRNTLLFALYTAISNVKPPLEVRSKRVGGSNRQIPAAVSDSRQRGYAIRWIIESASSDKAHAIQRKKRLQTGNGFLSKQMESSTTFGKQVLHHERLHPKQGTSNYKQTVEKGKNNNFVPLFSMSLADALKNAFYRKGAAFQKRNLWVEHAQANRAFLRYRWW